MADRAGSSWALRGSDLAGTTIIPDMGRILDLSAVTDPAESVRAVQRYLAMMPDDDTVYDLTIKLVER
jgi:hypothetical protein